MFKREKRTEILMVTDVEDLIEMLKKYPMNASVNICGDAMGYIHYDLEENAICIDTDRLGDYYEQETEKEEVKE